MMARVRENVLIAETASSVAAPLEFQEVFDKMDAYRNGKIAYEEYAAIPHATLMAARRWRIQRANHALAQRHPGLSLESDI